jgi:multidrug efflux system membrane fusion protein
VYLGGLGTITPLAAITVRTRVDGELLQVGFTEGQDVHRGDLLARIDPRPFQVQLEQAQGQLLRDQALLDNARVDLRRYQKLIHTNAIPRQQLDTQRALVRQYQAAVAADRGQVDAARLDLAYCTITAPIDGRVGLRLVDPGNIVHAGDAGGLVVITQLQPIGVVFTLPEDNLPALTERLQKPAKPAVEVLDRQQRRTLGRGQLLAVDNQVDPTTGTVRLKATLANPGTRLFPSQFVNARLLIATLRDALVVPQAAVQQGPHGHAVFVVKSDLTVEERDVTTGVADGDDRVVQKGLQAGERVVVTGTERLRAGTRVRVAP